MELNTGIELKDAIVEYLITLNKYEIEDIDKVKLLDEEDKISEGYLIKNSKVLEKNE